MNYKSKNKFNKHHNRRNNVIGKKIPLGNFLHKTGNLIIIKLVNDDIPYPNSKVFTENGIGSIEEIFGKFGEIYCAIRNISVSEEYLIEENRFINKNRLIPNGEKEKIEKENKPNEKKPVMDQKQRKFNNKFVKKETKPDYNFIKRNKKHKK